MVRTPARKRKTRSTNFGLVFSSFFSHAGALHGQSLLALSCFFTCKQHFWLQKRSSASSLLSFLRLFFFFSFLLFFFSSSVLLLKVQLWKFKVRSNFEFVKVQSSTCWKMKKWCWKNDVEKMMLKKWCWIYSFKTTFKICLTK